ncbi:MAG: ribonuclease P protein subunit [Candidatus Micrarchaeota archaeon]
MRTSNNLLFHTFIGLEVEVSNCSDRKHIGLKGKIIDETKNLIVIETVKGKEVKLPKASCIFLFHLDDGKTEEVEGKKIAFRPYERGKKVKV